MILAIPKEILEHEGRVAAIPETVRQYVQMGFTVRVEKLAGEKSLHPDQEYVDAGAEIVSDPVKLFAEADVVLKVKQPWLNHALGIHEAELIRQGATLVTFLHPATHENHETIRTLAARGITALTMDGVPRISRAQTMDALTSMSTITGYKAVLIAANRFPKFMSLLGTAIGTIRAAKCLVVGAGVVGLQAIATAKRLGGTVKAFDIREDARKAADSIGAKVAGFEVPEELAIAANGHTLALPDAVAGKGTGSPSPLVAEADIVILSALVPGEVAPVLVNRSMLDQMKPGSVIMDVSIDQGGNCELTKPGEECEYRDIAILGLWNIPGSMPVHASWLYAHNLLQYVKNLFKRGIDAPDLKDEIVQETLVTLNGKIVHAGTMKSMARC